MKMIKYGWIALLVVCMSIASFAQASVYGGFGHIWTGNGNAVYSVDTGSIQLNAGFDYQFSSKWGITSSIHNDTIKVENWLVDHNFSEVVASQYDYTVVDTGMKYVLNPADKAKISVGILASWYHNEEGDKIGYGAYAGIDYPIGKNWFVYTKLKYRYVEDFIVPVANVLETTYGFGYRF